MSNHNVIPESLNSLVGGVPGGDILEAFKASLMTEGVFKKLFGTNGERIICNTQVSLNTAVIPMLELRYKTDNAQSQETALTGRVEGRLIFPSSVKDADFALRRKVVLLIIRFLASEKFDIFERVPGLVEFGVNINFNYAVAFNVGIASLPGILIDIPYRLDIHKWKMAHPEIDPLNTLDGAAFIVETYVVGIQVEKDGVMTTVLTDSIPLEV